MEKRCRMLIRRVAAAAVLLLLVSGSPLAVAQTPSPLQEWQYSGGVILARLFEPNLPQWRIVAGLGGDVQPVYDGARAYHGSGGPVVDVRYQDVWFFSTGEGLGYNLLRGDHYQVGLGLTYDLGRHMSSDYTNLRGMGNITPAPVGKLYASVVLSRKFPLILRVSARQFAGGAQGAVGDAGLYIPLPGSSRRFVMFAGPSITVGTASGHPQFDIEHSGTAHAGVGFSATKFLGQHWLINLDAAISQIRGDPAYSPIVERRTERVLALSFDYHHE
jgi:outer membrane scaffolding protein for murein synthesis (MipA/OmpV family)